MIDNNKPWVGLDIDGILADFTYGFTDLARLMGLTNEVISCGAQLEWSFKSFDNGDPEDVWDAIKKSSTFWKDLWPLISMGEISMLQDLSERANIVFITSRKPLSENDTTSQTLDWLKTNLGIPNPNLVLVSNKVEVLKLLGDNLIGFIDDAPKKINPMLKAGIPVYIRDYAYNRDIEGGVHVGSVGEFIQLMNDKLDALATTTGSYALGESDSVKHIGSVVHPTDMPEPYNMSIELLAEIGAGETTAPIIALENAHKLGGSFFDGSKLRPFS